MPKVIHQRLSPILFSLWRLQIKKNGKEAQKKSTQANGFSRDRRMAIKAKDKQKVMY
jgi:hypothetical protein